MHHFTSGKIMMKILFCPIIISIELKTVYTFTIRCAFDLKMIKNQLNIIQIIFGMINCFTTHNKCYYIKSFMLLIYIVVS